MTRRICMSSRKHEIALHLRSTVGTRAGIGRTKVVQSDNSQDTLRQKYVLSLDLRIVEDFQVYSACMKVEMNAKYRVSVRVSESSALVAQGW